MQIDYVWGYDRTLVLWFGSSSAGEDVEEDCEDVTDKQSRRAEGDQCLNRGEADSVSKGKRGSKAQRAEDERY